MEARRTEAKPKAGNVATRSDVLGFCDGVWGESRDAEDLQESDPSDFDHSLDLAPSELSRKGGGESQAIQRGRAYIYIALSGRKMGVEHKRS